MIRALYVAWVLITASPLAAQPAKSAVEKRIDAEIDSLVALYKHFHAHPELALQEE